jgi:hypothetical protein
MSGEYESMMFGNSVISIDKLLKTKNHNKSMNTNYGDLSSSF